jgi:DNA-binding NarL/FixJ family response regulator
MEVVGLAVAGHDRRAIRERLRISSNTLKTHVRGILRRFEAESLEQVVRRIRPGLEP